MIIPIPSGGRRFKIKLGIVAFEPMNLAIRVYDPMHLNTYYFKRKVKFRSSQIERGETYREITIPLPLSPQQLNLSIFNKDTMSDQGFELDTFDVTPMVPSQVWAPAEMHRFIDFASEFAQKAGYTKLGFHHNHDHEFLIHYLPDITDQLGNTLVTPARTHRVTGRHQVSQRLFRKFSVPIRFFILLHEREHFVIPTRQEKPADLAALKIYLDMGFPKIEAIYAATKVFMEHPGTIGKVHVTRASDIMEFIENYEKQRELKQAA